MDTHLLERVLTDCTPDCQRNGALGIEPQENIGIFSQNKPECLFTDFGAFANRAVTIPLYATSSPAQAQYIINDAQIRYLFVGEQFQYDAAFSVF